MRTIGIIAAYDVSNRGDRAIVEAQIGWIKSHWPDATIIVFSSHHASNESVFKNAISALPVIDAPLDGSGLTKMLAPFTRWFAFRCGSRKQREFVLFEKCDAYLMCGGGYLYSSPAPLLSRQLAIHCANALLAISSGKPVLPFPQSWGPLRKKADEFFCKRLARRLEVVVTRGLKSTELVAELGFKEKVLETPDVVLAIRHLRPDLFTGAQMEQEGGPSLGISPINWSFDREINTETWGEYLDGLEKIASNWTTSSGGVVKLIPQVVVDGHDDDREVCEELAARLTRAGIPFTYHGSLSWEEHWEMIRRQSAFLGCRMHSCIFALVSHVPTVGLAYQPKFHELYGHLGLSKLAHEIDQFDPRIVSSQLLTLFREESERRKISEKVDQLAGQVVSRMNRAWEMAANAVAKQDMASLNQSWTEGTE